MLGGLCKMTEYPTQDKAVLQVLPDYISLNRIDEFRDACLRLLQTARKHLVVDIRSLVRIPSGVLAGIIDVGLLAKNGGFGEPVTVLCTITVAQQFSCFDHASALDIRQWDVPENDGTNLKLKADASAEASG
jgi:hypothetical protein